MKKLSAFFAVILILTILFSLAACKKGDDANSYENPDTTISESEKPAESAADEPKKEDEDNEPKRVLHSCMNLSDTFFLFLDDMMRSNFEAGGYIYDSVSAEMDSMKQIEQIENAVVQGYDLIIVVPANGEAVTDACQRAMDAGVLIFAFINDTYARNSYRTTSPEKIAETAVEMAMDWVNSTFPNAEDGSVNCVVMGNDSDKTSKLTHDTAFAAASRHPQLNIIENINCEGTILEGQAKAENALINHSDTEINLWIVVDSSQMLGVDAAIMAENSGVDYVERVCVTATALDEATVGLMKLSVTNESVVRCCAAPGGKVDDNLRELYEQAVRMMNGEPYDELNLLSVPKVWPEDLAGYGY